MNNFFYISIVVVFLFSCKAESETRNVQEFQNKSELDEIIDSSEIKELQKENKNQTENNERLDADLKELFIKSDFWIHKMLSGSYPDSTVFRAVLLESLSVKDIDNDGREELVYYGPSGSEPMITCIFEFDGDSLVQTFGEYQSIISLASVNDTVTEIIMSNPGCCMETVGYKDQFYYIHGQDSTYVQLLKSTANVDYMEEDGKVIKPIKFKTIQKDYNLRARPTTEEFIGENPAVIARLPSSTMGIAYREVVDSTGRIWWFVEIPPMQNLKVELYGDVNNKKIYHTGWISSRYVEIIK